MTASRPSAHGPVQTSHVLLLNSSRKTDLMPPPSPPTPSLSPPDSVCEHLEPLDLTLQPHDSSSDLDPTSHPHTDHNCSHDNEPKSRRLSDAVHVITTQAHSLAALASLYDLDPFARLGFTSSLDSISRTKSLGGKLILVGVGKSGHIAHKLVATFQSLGLPAVFLHPTEALHGDLGILGPHDTLIFITFSGKTTELLRLLHHIPETLQIIVITSHTRRGTCELLRRRKTGILLPAPIPESETTSFGVAAPTTSTTTALVVGDALAIAAARDVHPDVSLVFLGNHPGGSIGAAVAAFKSQARRTVMDIATPWMDIPVTSGRALGIDLLRAGFGSSIGWMRVEDSMASPSRIRRLEAEDLGKSVGDIPGLVMGRRDMIEMASHTSLAEAKDILRALTADDDGEEGESDGRACSGTVVAVVDKDDDLVGVVEAGQILSTPDI